MNAQPRRFTDSLPFIIGASILCVALAGIATLEAVYYFTEIGW